MQNTVNILKKEVEQMTHIETLIMNQVRKSLEDMEKQGVGFIGAEYTKEIQYNIDGKVIRVRVAEAPDAEH